MVNGEESENENDCRGRKYPPDTPSVETGNGDRSPLLMFLQEHARDDEAGDDEKDIDSNESAMEARQLRVIPDNQANGQCAEGLPIASCQYLREA